MINKDTAEKLRQAESWLSRSSYDDGWGAAAWEYITHLLVTTPDPEVRTEAQRIADKVLARPILETRIEQKDD